MTGLYVVCDQVVFVNIINESMKITLVVRVAGIISNFSVRWYQFVSMVMFCSSLHFQNDISYLLNIVAIS